jgi:hypothetical protein
MNFDLLQIDISKGADSWILLCGFGRRSLFYIEWNTRIGINRIDFMLMTIFKK